MSFAAVLGGIGLGAQVGGQIAAGVSRNKQAESERKAIDAAAEQDVLTTQYAIGKIRERAEETKSSQIAGYGRGGVVLEGSPLGQLVETTQKAEEDVFWEKQNMKNRLKMLKLKGTEALNYQRSNVWGTGLTAGGSLLSGIANMKSLF